VQNGKLHFLERGARKGVRNLLARRFLTPFLALSHRDVRECLLEQGVAGARRKFEELVR